jgi:hypothetical protein
MKILIASPVRQSEEIFVEYLKSLDNLIVPSEARVDRYFILNDCEYLSKHLKPSEYETINTNDEYKDHNWTRSGINKMSILRNRLIDKVIWDEYDYFFMVDSDLILHPLTLMQLLSTDKDLVANIFWTDDWCNCWDFDGYGIVDFNKWRKKGTFEVGGTGACFLISRKALLAGVNYSPISNIRCIDGEDRFFCIRAVCAGFKIYIDTHYPALHLYRQEDYKAYKRGDLIVAD